MISKVLVLGCLVTVSTLACQSHAAPKPANTVDRLALSLEDVKQISGFDGFDRSFDTDQPGADDYAPEGACQTLADGLVAFGDAWTQFRTVGDYGDLDVGPQPPPSRAVPDGSVPLTAPLMAGAIQTAVVYPDGTTAREVFDRRVAALTECANLNIPVYSGTISHSKPDTIVYTMGDNGLTLVFSLKSNVLVDVSVLALPEAERIASDISQEIIGRIN